MKKIIIILVPLVLIGGVFGAAKMGMIQIPGISPKKKNALATYGADKDGAALYGADKETLVAKNDKGKKEEKPKSESKPTKAAEKPAEPQIEIDEAMGRKKLAKLWNNLPVEDILKISKDWKDEDLALQFAVMDPELVSQTLAAMEAAKASKISKLIQAEASKKPIAE